MPLSPLTHGLGSHVPSPAQGFFKIGVEGCVHKQNYCVLKRTQTKDITFIFEPLMGEAGHMRPIFGNARYLFLFQFFFYSSQTLNDLLC